MPKPVPSEPVPMSMPTAETTQGIVAEIEDKPGKRKSTIDLVISKLKRSAPKNAEFDISRTSTSVFSRVSHVIRTGIEPVDTVTGGIPFGRITEIYGLEGCLKTALMLHICGSAQANNIFHVDSFDKGKFTKVEPGNIEVTLLYIDNECSLDDNNRLVVNGKKLDMILTDADTIDEIFKQIDLTIGMLEEREDSDLKIHKDSVEANKKSVAANKKDATKPIVPIIPMVQQFLVVVVDTIAASVSKVEMEAEWGKQDYSRSPKEIKTGFRKLTRRMNHRNVALICANQVGDSFAQKARNGPKFTLPQEADFATPGGKALKFFASLRIFMVNANPNYKVFENSKFPDGQVTQLFTKKNRQMKPLRTARMALLYRSGLSNEYSILEHLTHLKLCTWKDSGEIVFDFKKYGINPEANLQDDDETDGKVTLSHKQVWPELYNKHKAQFDALWEKARQIMFETDTLDFVGVDEDPDDDGIAASLIDS